MSVPRNPTKADMIAFCRQQAAEQRTAPFMGFTVLRPEGYPDLTYMTPDQIDAVADKLERE